MPARLFLIMFSLVLPTTTAVAADAWQRAADRGHLIVATVADRYPLSYRDESGAFGGFDVDVARQIGKRLGLDVTFEAVDWATLTAGNWDQRWDMSVSSMTPTAARDEVLDFPAVYRYAAIALVVHKDNATIAAASDASGRRIGVTAGTTLERYLRRDLAIYENGEDFAYQISDAAIIPYTGERLMFDHLTAGDGVRLDAAVSALTNVQAQIDNDAPLRVVPGFLFFEPFAVVVDQGETVLADKIEQVVDEMAADGTLSRLSMSWFEVDLTVGFGG